MKMRETSRGVDKKLHVKNKLRDVEDMIKDLYIAAGRDIEKTQKGIVFIDEFDKVKASDQRGDNKDVNGKAVQQSILKMIEGCEMDVKLNKLDAKSVKIDTTNILFILGGEIGRASCRERV